jgi:hypothetical protein
MDSEARSDLGEGSWPQDKAERERRLRNLPDGRRTWFSCLLVTLMLMAGTVGAAFAAWKNDDSAYIGLAILLLMPTAGAIWLLWASRSFLVQWR